MKKVILFLVLLITPFKVYSISAQSYIVMDQDNKNVLMGKNIDDSMLVASTSKIMTCIIALEKGNLNKTIKVTDDIFKVAGSSIYLEVGEKIKFKDLLYGMMMRSGNDAATMIAIEISGSMEDFTILMNKYAKKIGMKNTVFYNSHGLEDQNGNGNTSTSYDMALLTRYAMKNKTFRKIFKTKDYNARSNKKNYNWQNKNKLLKYDYITGGKTGYTKKAHRTLVTTGSVNHMKIIVVTLNDSNDWNDHKHLYSRIKNYYEKFNILDKDNFKIIDDSINLDDILYIKKDYDITIKRSDIKNISIKYYLNSKIKKGKVGFARIYNGEKEIEKIPIYKRQNKKGLFA